jgi:FAD/FMN-containing dehydrogenase
LGAVAYEAFTQAGMGFSASETPNNGVSGTLLGGGFSYFSRKEGLGCDQVISFQMMTWEGRIITATENNKYADLFWASCGGGGGNFGVVVSWTLKMMKVPDVIQLSNSQFNGTLDDLAQVMYSFQSWIASADNNLGAQLLFGPQRAPGVRVPMVYSGDGNIQDLQNQITSFGNVAGVTYNNASYLDAVTSMSGWDLKAPEDLTEYDWSTFRRMRKIKTVFVYTPYPQELIKALYQSLVDMYYAKGNIKFVGAGGKIKDKSPTATAFPHREALGWFIFQAPWDPSNSTEQAEAFAWLDAATALIKDAGYPDYAYVDYLDESIPNWQDAYFRFNYPRLTQVKTQYDPKDMFTFPDQGIQRDGLERCVFKPCVQDT